MNSEQQQKVKKYALIAAVLAVGCGYLYQNRTDKSVPLVPGLTGSFGSSTTAPNNETRKTFVIQAAGKNRSDTFPFLYLNDRKDYKDPNCFTVAVDLKACPQWLGADPKTLVGKTVVVDGVVSKYRDKDQIAVRDPAKIQVR